MGVRGLSPASAQNVHLRYACAVAACGRHRPRPQWGRISKEKLPHCSCCRWFSLVPMYPPSFGCHVLTPLFDETAQKTEAGCQYMTPCPWPSMENKQQGIYTKCLAVPNLEIIVLLILSPNYPGPHRADPVPACLGHKPRIWHSDNPHHPQGYHPSDCGW